MRKDPTLEEVDQLSAALPAAVQLQLINVIATRLHHSLAVTASGLTDLQLIEAEWVTGEHDEFVKLIQRYRSLYVTAMFVAFGWALGQLLGSPTTFEMLRARTDTAAVFSVLPFINVLFATLMLEAHAHVADLARYRYVLGLAVGGGVPPWRWNLWREKRKLQMVRRPTMVLNILSAAMFFLLTAGVFWFCLPALRLNGWLWVLWGPALFVLVSFLVTVGIVGLYWLKGGQSISRQPGKGESWDDLGEPH